MGLLQPSDWQAKWIGVKQPAPAPAGRVPLGPGPLRILSAIYQPISGAAGRDVTELLASRVQDGTLLLAVDNKELGGDPAPGIEKTLVVEYELAGITQIPTRPEIGLTFSNALKSVLRQSPDIVMIGEIRDFETADIAIKASLTGQLILSTLHTNDAAGALTRLIDMGVEPFLTASSLVLSSAQRLMRKICPNCKEEVDIPKSVLERIGLNTGELAKRGVKSFYKGKGCTKCNSTGYYGRIGILEALLLDDKVRDMIMKKTSSDEIKNYAIKELGMVTLRDNALENFMNGATSLEEVLRVTAED